MFKDTKEGETHSFNDGCIPPHTMPTQDKTESELEKLMEICAALEHARWARWQKYFFSVCSIKPQGEVNGMDDRFIYFALPKDRYKNWERQIETPYENLTEYEKEADRREVKEYLELIFKAGEAAQREKVRKWAQDRIILKERDATDLQSNLARKSVVPLSNYSVGRNRSLSDLLGSLKS